MSIYIIIYNHNWSLIMAPIKTLYIIKLAEGLITLYRK